MIHAGTATIGIELSPEIEPYKAVVWLETTVDGQAWARSKPGTLMHTYCELIYTGTNIPGLDYRLINQIYTSCSSGHDPGVAQGKHLVSIRAGIEGSDVQIAPATLEIDLSCPPAPDAGGADAQVDAANNDEPDAPDIADAAVQDGPAALDAAAPDADAGAQSVPPAPESGGGGCGVAPSSPQTMAAWLVFALGAALGSRRRRRA